MLFACTLALTAPAAADDEQLVGTWSVTTILGNTPPVEMSYVFDEDGSLAFIQENPGQTEHIEISGTYTVDGENLSILFEGSDQAMEVTFSIEDDMMTFRGIGDARHTTVTLEREADE